MVIIGCIIGWAIVVVAFLLGLYGFSKAESECDRFAKPLPGPDSAACVIIAIFLAPTGMLIAKYFNSLI